MDEGEWVIDVEMAALVIEKPFSKLHRVTHAASSSSPRPGPINSSTPDNEPLEDNPYFWKL